MTPTPIDELEAARKAWVEAEYKWRSLLRKHDIAENRLLVDRFFRGYDHDRDCDRYIHVRNLDHSGNLVGDIIKIYTQDSVELDFNATIRDDIDVMDEISMRNYVEFLLELNSKISRLMDQVS